jgi:hypothetical protein
MAPPFPFGRRSKTHPFVSDLLARTTLGPRQFEKALTLWPLVLRPDAPPPHSPEYQTLADAMEAGTLQVQELQTGARVPHVTVRNAGARAVLVLFGEELRGAKQNRIANASFLAPPMSEIAIDVSCVEQGRWAGRPGAAFTSSRSLVSHALRRKMASSVEASLEHLGRFHSDQGQVWNEVGARLRHSGIRSQTHAYEAYAASRSSDLRDRIKAFHPLERQVGFVAALGDEVVGLEAIGRPEVFARAFETLLRGYLIDAVDHALLSADRAPAGPARFDAPEPFLAALASAPGEARRSLGLGTDLRIDGAGVCACALVAGDVVHLTAFPAEARPS